MQPIEHLLSKVADPSLREQIAQEFATATAGRQFGLVFERHLPETVETPGVRPRPGNRVAYKVGDKTTVRRVLTTKGTEAVLVDVDADGTTGEAYPAAIDELVVVKEFREPIHAGMKRLGSINRGGDKPVHTVIRGENFHALEALLYTHEEKIDVIYIDPPYNTGSDSWIYNDKYVDSNDGYRHSKWLAFIERRLTIARRLLKPTGVIIAAIDDNEHHRLRMLMDAVFGESNFLANITWKGGGKNDARFTAGGIDYMVSYAKNREALLDTGISWTQKKRGYDLAMTLASEAWAEHPGDPGAATRAFRKKVRPLKSEMDPGVFRYNDIDESGRVYFRADLRKPQPTSRSRYPLLHPMTGQPVPMHENGWVYSPETMAAKLADGRILFGPDHTTGAYYKRYLDEVEGQAASPIVEVDRRRASLALTATLGTNDFPFPKDVDVVSRWLKIVSGNNPEAVFLDFFAGTGTTTEAVMRLNSEDGGGRQSIIVTNNELSKKASAKLAKAGFKSGDPEWEAEGVFEKVTRPRVETVVTGVRRDGSVFSEGLDENVEFLELTYEDEHLVALGRRFRAVAPLLWMRAGGRGRIIDEIDPAGFAAPADACYAVLFDTDAARHLGEAVEGRDDVTAVFIVSDSESAYQAAVRALPNRGFGLDTVRLYANYLRSFQINTQGA